MFDYYGMPDDWPGREASSSLAWDKKALYVEEKVHTDIVEAMGHDFNPKYFIPYVQLHEFEALAFVDVATLASVTEPVSDLTSERMISRFEEILDEAGHPEAINDRYETCPSRRIKGIVSAYRKRTHGPIITRRVGLKALREKCGHFASWLGRLERLDASS